MSSETSIAPLPGRIARLRELAYDLCWTWDQETRQVFRLLDYRLWRSTSHNPVRMLRTLAAEPLDAAARDPAFLRAYDAAVARLDTGRAGHDSWWRRRFSDDGGGAIAYFSAEFALHQSLPIYAGGLGVLAGDHCKEASDLGVPLVGVGFMYPQGYFHQRVSSAGGQEEIYETIDWADTPTAPAITPEGQRCIVSAPVGGRTVWIAVWRVLLGRVTAYLLDTHVEANAPEDRELSARLYGGDQESRLRQEIVLGIGGVRALRTMHIQPVVWHLNEGHAAFVALERLLDALRRGEPFGSALARIRRTTVFTTHTPVGAGHDAFALPMVDSHLARFWDELPEHREALLALGHHDAEDGARFNMTAFALRTAGQVNGVSRRHGEVTRETWEPLATTVSPDAPRITWVTNGVHVPSWIAPDTAKLFEQCLGADWRARHDDPRFWEQFLEADDGAVWDTRQALRQHLFRFMRERARQLWAEGQLSAERVAAAGVLLDPQALTIGFARRFTGYKRPELVFHDVERLARILNSRTRPVQIVFAGKSHPADGEGKAHLHRVFTRAVDSRFGGRIAFLEDYDLHIAHFLVQGCDVWLNTPRPPLEASGTSGIKAAMNGVLHLSVGDGWWAEGYTGANGWLIAGGTESGDAAAIDAADAEALYRLIEEVVVPTFFDRDAGGVPRRWVKLVKESICTTVPRFSARRMLKEYAENMYGPALRKARQGTDPDTGR
jgi:starch phosphorylase